MSNNEAARTMTVKEVINPETYPEEMRPIIRVLFEHRPFIQVFLKHIAGEPIVFLRDSLPSIVADFRRIMMGKAKYILKVWKEDGVDPATETEKIHQEWHKEEAEGGAIR